MKPERLQTWVRDVISPPPLGAIVEVTESCEYYGDWAHAQYVVIGHALKPDGEVDITIADLEDEASWRGWASPTDGFKTSDLRVVRLSVSNPDGVCDAG